MKKQLFIICLGFFVILNGKAQDWSKYEITTHKLTDQVYMLEGAGGNIGFFTGPDGNILIDDQFAPMTDKIKKAVSAISDLGIKYVINTHAHRDHTGGNENLANDGSILVAHDNVRKRMSSQQFIEFTGDSINPSVDVALPVVTFEKNMRFYMNDETVHVFHVYNGHTDGDALIYFEDNNVIHMGDTYFAGQYPFIDWSSGGSIEGLLKTLNKVILFVNGATQVIPGHGPVSTKAELIAYRNNIQDTRDILRDHIYKGTTMEDFLAGDFLKEQNETWGNGWIDGKDWVTTLYKLYQKDE